ncbi:MAG: hypothetical protein NTY67_09930 [Cyanobacteria bacterium]|nr:hypothetical protein [Cyanobacteriota bacterium]
MAPFASRLSVAASTSLALGRPVVAATTAPPVPAVIVSPGGITPAAAPAPVLSDAAFAKLIATASLETLDSLCRQLAGDNAIARLRLVRDRLLTMHLPPQPLAVVLANADVLLSCQAPDAALTVLDRYGPAPGAEQVQWLTLQWRAANAALDHPRAALALERLAAERYGRLEALPLPILRRPDGSVITRSALEVLADHLEAQGQGRTAGQLLLLSRQSDGAAAARLQQAIRLLSDLPPQELDALLERALEQAAAAGAWSLVAELLTTQAALPAAVSGSQRAIERQLRLTRRLDDAYGEWRLRRQDPGAAARSLELELKLRSPRAPGGHAADLPRPVAGAEADAAANPAPPASPAPSAMPAACPLIPEPAPALTPAPFKLTP